MNRNAVYGDPGEKCDQRSTREPSSREEKAKALVVLLLTLEHGVHPVMQAPAWTALLAELRVIDPEFGRVLERFEKETREVIQEVQEKLVRQAAMKAAKVELEN